MNIKPLAREDLDDISSRLQPCQKDMVEYFKQHNYFEVHTKDGEAYSVRNESGEIILCAGLCKEWEGRAVAWALFTDGIRLKMVSLVRAIKRYLLIQPFRRVEAYIYVDHLEGIRLAEMVGMKFEGTMKAFSPEGKDMYLYARVKV